MSRRQARSFIVKNNDDDGRCPSLSFSWSMFCEGPPAPYQRLTGGMAMVMTKSGSLTPANNLFEWFQQLFVELGADYEEWEEKTQTKTTEETRPLKRRRRYFGADDSDDSDDDEWWQCSQEKFTSEEWGIRCWGNRDGRGDESQCFLFSLIDYENVVPSLVKERRKEEMAGRQMRALLQKMQPLLPEPIIQMIGAFILEPMNQSFPCRPPELFDFLKRLTKPPEFFDAEDEEMGDADRWHETIIELPLPAQDSSSSSSSSPSSSSSSSFSSSPRSPSPSQQQPIYSTACTDSESNFLRVSMSTLELDDQYLEDFGRVYRCPHRQIILPSPSAGKFRAVEHSTEPIGKRSSPAFLKMLGYS